MSCRAAVEKLHSIDDAFRHQLESVQAAHQAELLQMETQKQAQIDQANLKVNLIHFIAQVSLNPLKLIQFEYLVLNHDHMCPFVPFIQRVCIF